jgi:gas vesicle structural protein
MTVLADGTRYLERPRANGLADVVDIILDKGLVIDAFVRVSLLGLELLTIDARIVIASVDTYLRFAEAVDRVVLAPAPTTGLQDLVGQTAESGAKKKVTGAAAGVKESAKDALGMDEGDEEEESERERESQRG